MFKIENDIPIPPTTKQAERTELRETIDRLQTQQSFVVPRSENDLATVKLFQAGRSAVQASQVQHKGRKFATRTLHEGLRIWRVA